MNTRDELASSTLTGYEAKQVRRIAAWKSKPPHPVSELIKRITLPVAKALESLIPERLVRTAIEKSYDAAEVIAGQEDVKRQAGVQDLGELRRRPLEECDRLARHIAAGALAWAAVEGAATGAGGMLTTLLDVPLLFILAMRTILKIGHCYGYSLDHHQGRHFVLGVLITAASGSLETRRRRLHQLHAIEDLLLEEAQEEAIQEEALSLLFQLEFFEEIPRIGTLSGAVLNLALIRRVEVTAQRVFQERWLHDNGKVEVIEPAAAHPLALATGWSGTLGRAAYSGCYSVGFGVALPAYFVASLVRPMDNALTRGVRDGAAAAARGAERVLNRARTVTTSSIPGGRPNRSSSAPAVPG